MYANLTLSIEQTQKTKPKKMIYLNIYINVLFEKINVTNPK